MNKIKLSEDFKKYSTEEKPFDCVKMMRDIRTKVFEKYSDDPEFMKKDLEAGTKLFQKKK